MKRGGICPYRKKKALSLSPGADEPVYLPVGLVVASVCYLQFLPAPSDEQGTRFFPGWFSQTKLNGTAAGSDFPRNCRVLASRALQVHYRAEAGKREPNVARRGDERQQLHRGIKGWRGKRAKRWTR
jgi:hypothetical protein